MQKRLLFTAVLILLSYTALFAWTEANLPPYSEASYQTGQNDTTSTAAPIPFNQTGTGYIASGNDLDNYTFTAPAALNNDILRVRLYVPGTSNSLSYGITLYFNNGSNWQWSSDSWANSGNTATVYCDMTQWNLAGSNNFLIQIRSTNNNSYSQTLPYTVNTDIMSSGTISGTLNLVGVGASGLSNVQVAARDSNGTNISNGNSNASGAYTLTLPVGLAVSELDAVRQWYPGCAADYAYGITPYTVSPAITLTTAGQTLPGYNFNVYKEGVVIGAINAAYNVDMSMYSNYSSRSNGYYVGSTNTAYGFHNLAPGNYWIWVQPHSGYGTNLAVSCTANVNVRDGFNTTVNYNIGAGYTVNGSTSPALPNGSRVSVMIAGNNKNGDDPFRSYYSVTTTGGNYAINNLPAGNYDFYAGDGPSIILPVLNQTISGNTVLNLTGPNPVTFISGTVIDNTGSGLILTETAVVAIVTGTADIMNSNVLAYVAMCDTSGNFNISVPPVFQYYDLAALQGINNNGNPVFMAWDYNVMSGTAGNALTITAGISVSGSMLFNGGPVSPYDSNAQVELMYDTGGGNYKFYDMCHGNDQYSSSAYLISGTAYNIKIRASGQYFLTSDIDTQLSTSPLVNQNFNMTIDPSKDKFRPYDGYMIPCQQGLLVNGTDYLYVTAGDYALGSGLGTVTIDSDSTAVTGMSYVDLGNNTRKYQFQLPASQQSAGSAHFIDVILTDSAGNVYDTGSTWQVNLATGTITPTSTLSPVVSATPTYTKTPTFSSTVTITETYTPTSTKSPTITQTYTVSSTPTYTMTVTVTPTTPPCGISGTITLPAASTGTAWVLYVDTDFNVGNGTAGSTGGTTNGNQISYNVSVLPGKYYIYVIVDESNTGILTSWQINDYAGVYGSTYLSPPGSPNATVNCPQGGTFDITAMKVTTLVVSPTVTPGASAPGSNDSIVYPIPAQNTATFMFTLNEDSDVTISIFDIAGNLADRESGRVPASDTAKMTVNVTKLKAGPYYYFISAKADSGAVTKYKLNKFIIKK